MPQTLFRRSVVWAENWAIDHIAIGFCDEERWCSRDALTVRTLGSFLNAICIFLRIHACIECVRHQLRNQFSVAEDILKFEGVSIGEEQCTLFPESSLSPSAGSRLRSDYSSLSKID